MDGQKYDEYVKMLSLSSLWCGRKMRGHPSSIDAAKKLAQDGAAPHGRNRCNHKWNWDEWAIEFKVI